MKRGIENEDDLDNIINKIDKFSVLDKSDELRLLKKCHNYIWSENEDENKRIIHITIQRYKTYMIHIDINEYDDIDIKMNKFFQERNYKKKYEIMKEIDGIILSTLKYEREGKKIKI